MSANIPTTTIQPIPESPPDTPSAIRAWRVMVARAINFLLKGVTGTPVTSVGNAAYSLLPSDRVVETSVAFTAARIWTLPAANSIAAGTEIAVLDAIATVTATNTLTVALSGSDKIDNSTNSIVLTRAGAAATLVSDGLSNWAIKALSGAVYTNSLGANVALNNIANYFDGPAVAQGTSGTWLASGTVTLNSSTAGDSFYCKLWDGTTVIASGAVLQQTATGTATIALSGVLAAPAGNLRISCRDPNNTTGIILFNATGNSKDSTITAVRIS